MKLIKLCGVPEKNQPQGLKKNAGQMPERRVDRFYLIVLSMKEIM